MTIFHFIQHIWILIVRRRFTMQSYCGSGERQGTLSLLSEENSGSLPQFFIPQNWVFRIFPLTSPLSYHPLCRSVRTHVKRFSRPKGSKELYKREKNQASIQETMRVRKMTIAEGKRVRIDRFPNFHKTGSVAGMKKLYYGQNCLLVKCYEKRQIMSSGTWKLL